MRTLERLLVLPVAISLLALAACEGAGEEEPAPADTVAAEEGPAVGAETGLAPGTAATSQLVVTNPMPHAMVVSVEYEGGGSTELGTVPANGEQAFTIAASPGETVTLTARDEADTHAPQSTLTLSAESSWTIQ